MAEELQSLLEKIQKDGVARAETQAQALLEDARRKAQQIVADAESAARAKLAAAEKDGEVYTERSRKALEQAARDVILLVGNALNGTLKALVAREVGKALTGETLKTVLADSLSEYFRNAAAGLHTEVLVNPSQQALVTDYLMSRFSAELRQGVEIKPDAGISAGFKVSASGNSVVHDFTAEAIAESLGQLLRPEIAAAVRNAASAERPR
jgi:V/A-type H+/Na+-transporting ATPase subunit E